MATFTYLSFASKKGLLVRNGGAWTCTVGGGSCSQGSENNAYGPIMITSTTESNNGSPNRALSLQATINLADDEFKGATKIPSTISFNVQATVEGGSPAPMIVQSNVGGILFTYPQLQYNNTNFVSLTHSGAWEYRPSQITLDIGAIYRNSGTSTVTLAISDLTFIIHDVVYGTASIAGSSPPASSASSSSFISSYGSTSTSSTNRSMSLLRSTSFTTTIPGYPTVMRSTIPQYSNSGSQSPSPTLPNSSTGTSMTASERASVISSSLLGLILILASIAFWCWWRRQNKIPRGTVHGDGQSETDVSSKIKNQEPWVRRSYHRSIQNGSYPDSATIASVEEETISPTELEGYELQTPSLQTGYSTSGQPFSPPPPARLRLTLRPPPSSLLSSGGG